MNDYTIRVTPETLLSSAEEISKKAGTIETAFAEMKIRIEQSSSYWIGEAADLHRSLFQEQIPLMDKIVNRFYADAQKLREIAGNYSSTVQTVTALTEDLPDDVIV